jgi:hypothetical protein
MHHRDGLKLLSLMFLVGACAGAATSGGASPTPDAGADPDPVTDPEPTPTARKDAASSAGATDSAATPPEVDAGRGSDDDAGAPPASKDGGAPPSSTGPGSGDYSCTLVIGIAATGQWFNAGFEKLVDGSKWELLAVHSGFIQGWADPNGSFWNMTPSSACATNAKTPDRVIQVALYLHWMEATVDQWVTQLDAVVKNWKAKNPNLKRLEFATFVRAPDDKPCPGTMPFKSYIKPEQDMAYEKIAAMYPGLVYVAPRWEVRSCADFGGNPPHFSTAGAQAAAKQIADYYNMK